MNSTGAFLFVCLSLVVLINGAPSEEVKVQELSAKQLVRDILHVIEETEREIKYLLSHVTVSDVTHRRCLEKYGEEKCKEMFNEVNKKVGAILGSKSMEKQVSV